MKVKRMKFVIVAPAQKYGGTIALYSLCKYLCEIGFDAKIIFAKNMNYRKNRKIIFWIHFIIDSLIHYFKIFCVKLFGEEHFLSNSNYAGYVDIPVKGCKYKIIPIVNKNTIVVYPDIAYGNFLHSSNVVRWLLYYNRFANDENAYGKKDMFICYRKIFNDTKLNPNCRTLEVVYFNLNLYKRTNFGKREGNCYVIRKGSNRRDLPKEFDGIVIDNLSELEKVIVFNKSEYCICYDTQTAYSGIASICGCISVIIPEEGKSRSSYRSADESIDGVAFGFSKDELARAKKTAGRLIEQYESLNTQTKNNIVDFVELCENYFEFKDNNLDN